MSSDKHSDLYTDENPKGHNTRALGFTDSTKAVQSINKLKTL